MKDSDVMPGSAAHTRHGRYMTHERPHTADPRDLVRRRTYAVEPLTVDAAASAMDALGHDFLLFVDADTGRDSLLERLRDGDLGLRSIPLSVDVDGASQAPVPSLTVEQAAVRLAVTGARFVFFRDLLSGRGAVVYRRDDDHDGVITTEGVPAVRAVPRWQTPVNRTGTSGRGPSSRQLLAAHGMTGSSR